MNARYWTAEVDSIILSGTKSDEALAIELGRSVHAIRLRRWKVRTGRASAKFRTGRPANRPEDVWKFVDVRGPDDCWPWLGAKRRRGYGVFSINHKDHVATRVIYKLVRGDDPGELFVCHTCDNPPCCNPAHFFLGTHTDNMRDMVAKGRDRWKRAAA